MADHPHRGRNRPDSRAMWDESDRRNQYGGGARDRRDNRDRYRDERPRSRDRRQRTRSRSPINERSERRERNRSRDRDYDRDRRRGYEGARDKADGRHYNRERDPDKERERERERDGRRRDDGREETTIPRGPARRGDPRRSLSPHRSPLGKPGRATHGPYSPLPTRSKTADRGSGNSSVRGDPGDDDLSRKGRQSKKNNTVDIPGDEDRQGRRPNREDDSGADAMDEDDSIAVEEDDEMSAMQAMMGFGGFGSTKGQKVAGNNAGAVHKAKKTEYRQYMNRVGGFNRPLSPGR
ncbi:hypothetical protein F4801DRAFT_288570 [Xylaria longipes]|nr:hypothetical protein F4801DRAFT_288570 [Xylaria longipes]